MKENAWPGKPGVLDVPPSFSVPHTVSCWMRNIVQAVSDSVGFTIIYDMQYMLNRYNHSQKIYWLKEETMSQYQKSFMTFGSVIIYPADGSGKRDGMNIYLTDTQLKLVLVLVEYALTHPDSYMRTSELARLVLRNHEYKNDFDGPGRRNHSLNVHMHNLRKAIEENPSKPVYLQTKPRGGGYRLDIHAEGFEMVNISLEMIRDLIKLMKS